MAIWRQLARGVRALINRADSDQDVDDEVAHFLEQSTAARRASGLSPRDALRAARLEFGNVSNVREQMHGYGWENVIRGALIRADLKVAVRSFARSPGFTLTALLTLALCLGANLTIFAVIDAVLLRALPFPHADRLVAIYNSYPKAGVDRDGSSVTNYYERRGRIPALAAVSLYRPGSAIVGESGATERTTVVQVTADFFSTLGVGPRIGRAFVEREMDAGRNDVAILTDGLWRERFGADTGVVGRQFRVNGTLRTIVGVLPTNFSFLSLSARVVLPLASRVEQRGPNDRHSGTNTEMIARLRPGASIADAQAQIDAHNAVVEQNDPAAKMIADAGFRSVVLSLHGDHVASIRPILLLLQAGVLVLVLIGSVNLANLLSIRAGGRARELMIRQSIGAGRAHVVSQIVVETLVLTLTGGGLGLAVGVAGIHAVSVLGVDQLPLGARVAFDARAALATLIAAVAIGIAIALPVAWFHLRGNPAESLGGESRGNTAGRSAHRLRNAFTVAQVGLAFVLLAGSLLLSVSLDRAAAVSPGFHPSHVLTGQISLPHSAYGSAPSVIAFTDRLDELIAGQPGVIATGIVTNIPLSGNTIKSEIRARGYSPPPGESLRGHYTYGVAGDYFAALGIPLREGRYLTAADGREDARICVVDEDFANRYWPGQSAIGRQVYRNGEEGKPELAITIVGVVSPVKQADITEAAGQGAVYFPFALRLDADFYVVVRTSRSPESFAATLAALTHRIDRDLPVAALRSMDDRVSQSLIARRSPAVLAGVFAAVALLLAAIGTYGVLSYAVSQRRREIGVRLALGAQPQQIGGQFFSRGVRLLAAGLALGLIGTWVVGHLIQGVLFDVPAFHAPTLAVAALIICGTSLVAAWIPARRATSVDPVVALRAE